MRAWLAVLVLVAFVLPAGADAVAVHELPLSSRLVPRMPDEVAALPPAARPLLPAAAQGPHPAGEPGSATTDAAAGTAVPDDAFGAVLAASAGPLDAERLARAFYGFGVARGWAPAMTPPSHPEEFEENSTVSYTFDLGDVDRDGVGDLALDVYCTALEGCPLTTQPVDVQGAVRSSLGTFCSKPHLLFTVSGRDGHVLRNESLDVPHAVPPTAFYVYGCTLQFVIGTLPLPDGTRGLLVYQLSVLEESVGPERLQILHDLRLVDMKTGEPAWTYHEEGKLLGYPIFISNGYVWAQGLLINPLIQEPPLRGVGPVPRDRAPTLDLQVVGYNFTNVSPGLSDGYLFQPSPSPPMLVKDYQPDERMVRLDPTSGAKVWDVRTFSPGERPYSVLPRFSYLTPHGGSYPQADPNYDLTQTQRVHDHFWADRRCCYDLTGDGINDFAATTLEWSDQPTTNQDGFYGWRSRLVVFDGADGHRLSEATLVEDTDVPTGSMVLQTYLEPLGDGDGDGTGELVVHTVSYTANYRHVLSVRHADGSEAWRIDSPRELETLVVGDADRDGGNDLLLLEWTLYEGRGPGAAQILAPYTNVTHLPMKVFSGKDGALVWRHESFGARIDAVLVLNNLRNDGVPDLDGNGVAEVLVDDPTLLPDRTVLHRLAFMDPRSDRALARIVSVGAFALPAMAGDADGDGRDDLALINGDINDLWLTLFDPHGHAFWSRRILAPHLSGYAQAIPTLRTHSVASVGRAGHDLLLNFQMSSTTVGSFIVTTSLTQQITGLRGGNGTLVWANPGVYDANETAATPGASPASALFKAALDRDAHPVKLALERDLPLAVPGAATFATTAALGFLVLRRLRR